MRQLLLLIALIGLSACAAMDKGADAIRPVTLQKGLFRLENCQESYGEGRVDACLCRADITAARSANTQLNDRLAEEAIRQFCAGEPALQNLQPNPEAIIAVNQTDFTVTRNDSDWLSVVYLHYHYPAGAAHGMSMQHVLLYDKAAAKWREQGEIVPEAFRRKAGGILLQRLQELNRTRYANGLWLDALSADTLFNSKGCDGCVLYPDKHGWKAVFGLYAIGPYAFGLIEVPLAAADIGR